MEDYKHIAKEMRLCALNLAHNSGKQGAHLGGGLSAIEIFTTLYHGVLHYNVNNPIDENRDRLIVSKGHCVLAYYAALKDVGFMTADDLCQFEVNGQHLHGHAMRNIAKGIEFSGGSLSMGVSFAIGEAIACKKKGLQNKVYVLLGDGECDEGLVWEAAMSAANYGLNNLSLIVDQNQLQYDGPTKEVMNQISLAEKFRAFGFDTIEVDGHDCEVLKAALLRVSNQPQCVIAKTVKGKGVSFMEGVKEWHHGTLSDAQYAQSIEEVNKSISNKI